jgi:hypothetical protein
MHFPVAACPKHLSEICDKEYKAVSITNKRQPKDEREEKTKGEVLMRTLQCGIGDPLDALLETRFQGQAGYDVV